MSTQVATRVFSILLKQLSKKIDNLAEEIEQKNKKSFPAQEKVRVVWSHDFAIEEKKEND